MFIRIKISVREALVFIVTFQGGLESEVVTGAAKTPIRFTHPVVHNFSRIFTAVFTHSIFLNILGNPKID